MARKNKENPALEKKEEKLHKDMDGDDEKGAEPTHRARVFGSSSGKGKQGKGGATPPKAPKGSKKMMPVAKKKGMTSC